MLVAQSLCDNLKCGNAGRYLVVDGRTLCSLCAMKSQLTAVRLIDMPTILQLVASVAKHGSVTEDELAAFRLFLPRNP
jgi:hypothetical protein